MRDEKVVAKGKGELITYWLEVKSESDGEPSVPTSETASEQHSTYVVMDTMKTEKMDRLIDWNADILCQQLKKIIASRAGTSLLLQKRDKSDGTNSEELYLSRNTKPVEEVKEIIALPKAKKLDSSHNETTITVSSDITDQLRQYVSCIATLYKNNEFHCFEHVSVID